MLTISAHADCQHTFRLRIWSARVFSDCGDPGCMQTMQTLPVAVNAPSRFGMAMS
jgi:hypothetical protein